MATTTSRRLGLCALLAGTLLILSGITTAMSDWFFFRDAVNVEGTVWYTSSTPDGGGRGVRVRVPAGNGSTEVLILPYHIAKTANAKVIVAWPEGQPEAARINSAGERVVVPLLFIVLALPMFWASRWLRDESLPDWAQEDYLSENQHNPDTNDGLD